MLLPYEEAREYYRPNKVRVIFIGESRPAAGTFFYHENSNLFRYTKEAFEQASGAPFNCEAFKRHGCWLYDICDEPVNKLAPAERRKQIKKGLLKLEKILKELKPEFVIAVKKGDFLKLASPIILNAGFIVGRTFFSLPFPANSHQRQFAQELVSALRESIFRS
ncbi:MAG: hypothetical protein M1571_10520 [Firmicutes bacterium]|nr:hypothetical protein [Bacillota bacterium]